MYLMKLLYRIVLQLENPNDMHIQDLVKLLKDNENPILIQN